MNVKQNQSELNKVNQINSVHNYFKIKIFNLDSVTFLTDRNILDNRKASKDTVSCQDKYKHIKCVAYHT